MKAKELDFTNDKEVEQYIQGEMKELDRDKRGEYCEICCKYYKFTPKGQIGISECLLKSNKRELSDLRLNKACEDYVDKF